MRNRTERCIVLSGQDKLLTVKQLIEQY